MSKQPVLQQIRATITGKDAESGILIERSYPRFEKSLLRRIVTISDTLMENPKMMISSCCPWGGLLLDQRFLRVSPRRSSTSVSPCSSQRIFCVISGDKSLDKLDDEKERSLVSMIALFSGRLALALTVEYWLTYFSYTTV